MYQHKVVMITGGTGSLGTALVEKFRKEKVKKVIVYSRDEWKQSQIPDFPELRRFLGDVRDLSRLRTLIKFAEVDIVIHAAALKQVPTLEFNPHEAVRTNVLGSGNVVQACIDCGVQRCILVSTDKAVEPVNLYGATKLAAEKLFLAANNHNQTSFAVVRYGNVVGSRGSLVPLIQKLRERNESVPVTDPNMTRFWISLDEAVRLVQVSMESDIEGVFVPCAPSMRIPQVIDAVWPHAPTHIVGIRPGEKLHESMVSANDSDFVYGVSFSGSRSLCRKWTQGAYTSDKAKRLTKDEFRDLAGLKDVYVDH